MKYSTRNPNIIGFLFTLTIGIALLLFPNDTSYARSTEKGWLGVGISELTPSIRRDAGLKDQSGILISSVYNESPAKEAGLEEDDIILTYDGKSVQYDNELIDLVQNTAPGTKVKLEIFRDGKIIEKKMTIGKKKSFENHHCMPFKKNIKISCGTPHLGVHIQDLDKDLAEYFHVEEHKGVAITKVIEDSPAEKAGLKSGDVIVKIGDEPIHYTEDVQYSLKNVDDGNKVPVKIIRKSTSQTVEVTLESKDPIEIKIRKHGFDHDLDFDRIGDIDIDLEDLEIDLDHILDNMENTLEKLFDEIGI